MFQTLLWPCSGKSCQCHGSERSEIHFLIYWSRPKGRSLDLTPCSTSLSCSHPDCNLLFSNQTKPHPYQRPYTDPFSTSTRLPRPLAFPVTPFTFYSPPNQSNEWGALPLMSLQTCQAPGMGMLNKRVGEDWGWPNQASYAIPGPNAHHPQPLGQNTAAAEMESLAS